MTHVQDIIESVICEDNDCVKKSPIESSRKDSGIESDSCNIDAFHAQIQYSEIDHQEHHFQDSPVANIRRSDSYESVVDSAEDDSAGVNSEEDSPKDSSRNESPEHSDEIRCDRSESVASDGSSEEGARDSGIEAERELDMVIPDQDITQKIVDQVELYFSDDNVTKDKFLLKHIRRNKEGYVSLKLVSSFKKVKQITKDWRVVSYALIKGSSNIQINDEGTKIRRVQPLPQIDDSPVTCAVLALDLPLESPTIENVSKLFSSSDITFIRILRAGGNLPPDVKSYLTKYPELGHKHCAWIEFETPEAARNATQISLEGQMRIVLIVPESQKKQEKQKQQQQLQKVQINRRNSVNGYNNQSSVNAYKSPNNKYIPSNQIKPRKNSFNKYRVNDMFNDQSYRRPIMQRRKAVSLPSSHLPNISELSTQDNLRRAVRPKSKSCVEFSPSGAPCTSWVQRHLLAAAAASAASAASPINGSRSQPPRFGRLSSGSLPLPEGVVRFPKGPDVSSRGFGRSNR